MFKQVTLLACILGICLATPLPEDTKKAGHVPAANERAVEVANQKSAVVANNEKKTEKRSVAFYDVAPAVNYQSVPAASYVNTPVYQQVVPYSGYRSSYYAAPVYYDYGYNFPSYNSFYY